jgi:hypothetical protein
VPLDDLQEVPLTPAVVATATERIMASITTELQKLRGGTPPAQRFDPRAAGVPLTGNPHKRKGQVER